MSETTQTENNKGEKIERIAQGQDPVKVVEKWFEDSDEKPWEKIEAGQTKVLVFVMSKIERVEKEFQGQKKVQYRFTVINEQGQEKTIDFSKRWAENIFNFLKKGYQKIEISRKGAGTDTEYIIIPLQH